MNDLSLTDFQFRIIRAVCNNGKELSSRKISQMLNVDEDAKDDSRPITPLGCANVLNCLSEKNLTKRSAHKYTALPRAYTVYAEEQEKRKKNTQEKRKSAPSRLVNQRQLAV